MKPHLIPLAFAGLCATTCLAEEAPDPIDALRQAAENFVIAFNDKDAEALSKLFTEDARIDGRDGGDATHGREAIRARYEALFAEKEVGALAIEVDEVSIVAEDVAIEDGTAHFTLPGDDEVPRSLRYSAVLKRTAEGEWLIANSRTIDDVTAPEGRLEELAERLNGDWTSSIDGTRVDLAIGWDETGKFLIGEMLVNPADGDPQTSTLRYAWDGARNLICCWTFDDQGGFAKADWTPSGEGYEIRTEGTTAHGETMSANQSITFPEPGTFLWKASERMVDGEPLSDIELRVVRQAPEPAAN